METPKHIPRETGQAATGADAAEDRLDEALDGSFPASDPVPGPAIALPTPASPAATRP